MIGLRFDIGTLSLIGPGKHRCGDAVIWREGAGFVAAAVADGVSTRPCDYAASEVAVRAALDSLAATATSPSERLARAAEVANAAVRDRATGPCVGMRSTLVLALWDGGDAAYVLSVGDSRGYRAARGEESLRLLTEDDLGRAHVPPNLRHLERAEGRLLFREGLTRSLGQPARLDVQPREVPFLPGEALVLATDGMWESGAFAHGTLAACASLDLQDALDRWALPSLDRDDDASLAVLRRSALHSCLAPEEPVGPADRYVAAAAAYLALEAATVEANWALITSITEQAHKQSLRFGRERLVALADQIAATPGAERRAFEAVLDLARAER